MTTTFSPASASAHITATVTPDEPTRFEEGYGWEGKTRTVQVTTTTVRWSINLVAGDPTWKPDVRTMARWVKKDGTLGVASHTLYGYSNTPQGAAIRELQSAAIEATRPDAIPSFTMNPGA